MSKRAVKNTKPVSEPKIKVLETHFADMRPGQLMVIPTPELIKTVIEGTQKGQALSMTNLRQALAKHVSAEVACPVTSSIYLRKLIESEWSQEHSTPRDAEHRSTKGLAPFWRVVAPGMPIYKKLDLSIQAFIESQRALEGIQNS
jgi:hypothetical protein